MLLRPQQQQQTAQAQTDYLHWNYYTRQSFRRLWSVTSPIKMIMYRILHMSPTIFSAGLAIGLFAFDNSEWGGALTK